MGLFDCPDCSNTGCSHRLTDLAAHLVDTVITNLPAVPGCAPTWPGAEWSLPYDLLIEHITGA
jgi:hypothetical protein